MQINLLPTSSERLSISPALLFTKGQTQSGNYNHATERKSKAVNKRCVNYDVKMDRGTMTLTSSVSLPKDNKHLCWVNKLRLGNWQNYKRTAMLIMLNKVTGSIVWALHHESRLFIHQYLLTSHPPWDIYPEHLAGIKLRATTNVANSKQRTTALTLYV